LVDIRCHNCGFIIWLVKAHRCFLHNSVQLSSIVTIAVREGS
jgi:hypothetical protein